MLVSLNWLKDYVDINIPVEEFCDRMIMSGSNLETCEETGTGIENVKIGKIVKIEKHPNADRLIVCTVDLGGGDFLPIVTGASNLYEGAYVPVALHNSRIPGPLHGQPKKEGGVKITKGKLRGVESMGMLCGPQELGFDDKVAPMISRDGIWLLPGNWEKSLGKDIDSAMGLHDYRLDFEITPNRPDCLSMLGMAREAAAILGKKIKYPETDCPLSEGRVEDYISVEVKSDLCRRYTARVIKNVKIGQSPWWMQKRLMAAGMRPINNMVDITNFVMLEYGQPIHAFDIKSIAGNKIIVDTAEAGTEFVTLDGIKRKLDSGMLMINDVEKPVAVAGVMGGLNSGITGGTDVTVIESACFSGSSVRKTSKKMGLRTEASGRFEKGIDPGLCGKAADRVCSLAVLMGCGEALPGMADVYKSPVKNQTIHAGVLKINKVLGTQIPREEMVRMLENLEMEVRGQGEEILVTPPSVRGDLSEEVDIVEEIARMYGYDRLPLTLPSMASRGEPLENWILRDLTRDVLCGMGANEIQTFSFSNDKALELAGIVNSPRERDFVEIFNPLGEDTAALRTLLTPGMLETLGRNFSRSVEKVRAYEIGLVFARNFAGGKGLPEESHNLCIGTYGEGEDFFALKGMVTALLKKLGLNEVVFAAEHGCRTYHPGRCAKIFTEDKKGRRTELGIMGEIHPDIRENFSIGIRAHCCELFFDLIAELSDRNIHYRPLPKYPSASRDIAMIADEDLTAGEIEKVIREAGSDILSGVKLFDVYRGEQAGKGRKSVAFSLTYRSGERTLKDGEVESAHSKVLQALKDKLHVMIRDN